MVMEKCKVSFESWPWQSPSSCARFKAFQHVNRRLRLVEFSRGFAEPDWCTKGHVGYVLAGEMEIDFGGDRVRFAAGDGIFIPAGPENRHKATVLSDTVTLVLVEDAEA